jgi:hypothetical protein
MDFSKIQEPRKDEKSGKTVNPSALSGDDALQSKMQFAA